MEVQQRLACTRAALSLRKSTHTRTASGLPGGTRSGTNSKPVGDSASLLKLRQGSMHALLQLAHGQRGTYVAYRRLRAVQQGVLRATTSSQSTSSCDV